MFKTLFRAINQWLHALTLRTPAKIPIMEMVVPSGDSNPTLIGGVQKLNRDFNAIVKFQDKDLDDLTETPNCGSWNVTEYHCPDCEKTITFDEYIKDFCKSCGVFSRKEKHGRSWRKVIHGGYWKFQLRYKNGHSKVVDKVP